jgi:hypothetical protein
MKKTIAVFLVALLSAPLAYAGPGPIAASAERQAQAAAAQTPTTDPKPATNKLLWPGLALVGGGATLAVVGFTRTTGASVDVNCDYWDDSCNISANEKHNTGLAIAGAGIAGLGGFLIWKGENDKNKANSRLELGPNNVRWTVKF